ncbi:hypothetical protein G0Q06_00920 [Puniceicoccales bacterium CK1056]|uniref:EF-hand domain-containing protein n=1 Tax=Oceanipulchritudo coccoides TaxID=2706888 RepID=A0A6B2LYK0_9BACT|nr:hypothetical protein [Oceanipulchritudo coccoides]NDV61004.1 hypothetical protein [Oceanipulchritudo coccoides]
MKKLLILASLLVLSASTALAAKTPKMFTEMDADNNGQVDVQEWMTAEKKKAEDAGKKYNEKQSMKRMGRKDANGDNMISADEFIAARKSMDSGDKAKKKKKD